MDSARVADYFIVVGAFVEFQRIEEDSSGNPFMKGPPSLRTSFHSFVTDRYPVEDRPGEELPEGIQLFCLPYGVQVSEVPKRPSLHSFVHTNPVGEHLQGYCLTFYDPITATQRSNLAAQLKGVSLPRNLFVPRCLCIVSRWSFSSAFKQVLCGLYLQHFTPSPLPIERFICNFIDDVPAPAAARVDVTYYLNEQPITFKYGPPNEPQVWSSTTLFPLLECLPPAKILDLLVLLITERQIVFISQQLSLLAACASAAVSLTFPLSWPHAFIPILPRQLVGVLEAPNPFIVGIPASYLADCSIQPETVRVNLDEGTLDLGAEGPGPELPESLRRRLLRHIGTWGPAFASRGSNWRSHRLLLFDDAFCSVTDHSSRQLPAAGARQKDSTKSKSKEGLRTYAVPLAVGQRDLIHERRLRVAFLNLFLALLQPYRRFLIPSASLGSGSATIPGVEPEKFRATAFLLEQPATWRPLLRGLLGSQSFSQFVDERCALLLETGGGGGGLALSRVAADVVFFDEAIEARARLHRARAKVAAAGDGQGSGSAPGSTTGASSGTATTAATGTAATVPLGPTELPASALPSGSAQAPTAAGLSYVPPTPDASGIGSGSGSAATFSYPRFPRLSPTLFCQPRMALASSGSGSGSARLACDLLTPLKRTAQAPAGASLAFAFASATDRACIYSLYVSCVGQAVAAFSRPTGMGAGTRAGTTTNQVLANFAPLALPAPLQASSGAGAGDVAEGRGEAEGGETGAGAGAGGGGGEEGKGEDDEELAAARAGLGELALGGQVGNGSSGFSGGSGTGSGSGSALDMLLAAEAESELETSVISAASGADVGDWVDGEAGAGAVPTPTVSAPSPANLANSVAAAAAAAAVAAARLGLRVSVEVLNILLRCDGAPDDAALRSMIVACAAVGEGTLAVDILALMQEGGVLPDRLYLLAAAQAISGCSSGPAAASEVWARPDWRELQRRRGPDATSQILSRRTKSFAVALPPSPSPSPSSPMSAVAQSKDKDKDKDKLKGQEQDSRMPPKPPAPGMGLSTPTKSGHDGAGGRSPVKKNGAASTKLSRHFAIAEALLEQSFPRLVIDLTHALGTQCPGRPRQPCSPPDGSGPRPLTLVEIAKGWTVGDGNSYTTKCCHCGTAFVPRFAVSCEAPDWVGSEGPRTPLWCELLSPWTLRKEMLGLLVKGGVSALTAREARDGRSRPQAAVVFWNALLAFRQRGLPYTFLLAESDLAAAFPPNSSTK